MARSKHRGSESVLLAPGLRNGVEMHHMSQVETAWEAEGSEMEYGEDG